MLAHDVCPQYQLAHSTRGALTQILAIALPAQTALPRCLSSQCTQRYQTWIFWLLLAGPPGIPRPLNQYPEPHQDILKHPEPDLV